MSETRMNVEIEDVLASIRRLVGDSPAAPSLGASTETGWRDISAVGRSPANDGPRGTKPALLVLTPDHRIANLAPTPDAEKAALDRPFFAGPPEASSQAARQNRSTLLETIAELEAAVNDRDEEFEPDGSETTPIVDWDKPQDTSVIFRSCATASELTLDVASDPSVNPTTTDPTTSAAPTQAGTIPSGRGDQGDDVLAGVDEDTLRRLVADAVRDELQGALGDRLSRNMRKLVRREVYRALATQDLS